MGVSDFFKGSQYEINVIEFADGTFWYGADIHAMVDGLAVEPSSSNDDALIGSANNDIVSGLSGNDTIFGNNGNDILSGDDGNDYLYGHAGDDILSGDDGNDYLYGHAGDDILSGGFGNDYLRGGEGNDILEGNGGNDLLRGGEGVNTYKVGASDGDTIIYFSNNDKLQLIDLLPGDIKFERDTRYYASSSFNSIYGDNDLLISFENSNATITIKEYFDDYRNFDFNIEFSDGTLLDSAETIAQFLNGNNNSNVLFNDDDYREISFGVAVSYQSSFHGFELNGYGGDDIIKGGVANEVLNGGDGTDLLYGSVGDDILRGDNDNDYLYGEVGNDLLEGGAGNDFLSGGSGDDILSGGTGWDSLQGNHGDDTYLYSLGDGNTTINNDRRGFYLDSYIDDGEDTFDILSFDSTILVADISVTQSGSNLYLNIISTENTIKVANFFNGTRYELSAVVFDDGTTWSTDDLKVLALGGDLINSTTQSISINLVIPSQDDGSGLIENGTTGSDYIEGTYANDVISGSAGDDRIFGNYGDDTLKGDGGYDQLYGGAGTDTYLYEVGDGNTIINNGNYRGDEKGILSFINGFSPNNINLSRLGRDLILTVISSNEVITVSSFFSNDSFGLEKIEFDDGTSWSEEEIHRIVGATIEEDIITGDVNDNIINGLDKNDQLHGGLGSDQLSGDEGNDQLHGDEGNDNLSGGNGTDYLYGGSGNDVLNGGSGINDVLIGGSGDDTYLFDIGDENTLINNEDVSSENHDILQFAQGIEVADVSLSKLNNDLILTIESSSEEITVSGYFSGDRFKLDVIEFFDGTVWDKNTISSLVLGDTLDSDYIFNRGDGYVEIIDDSGVDKLQFGENIAIEDISVSRVGNDLVLDINDPNNVSINDQIIIKNWDLENYQIESFEFSDGQIVSNIVATYASMLGSENDDNISLWRGTSYFEGLGGNDVVTSIYTENNTILGGDGNDIITDKGGDDTILGGAGNDIINIEGTGNNIILGDDGADLIHISNTSSNVVLGGSGDDLIQVEPIDLFNNSNAGQINFYEGGLGNDSFHSGASSDTYIFNRGDGQDTINDNSQSATLSGVDKLQFGEGIAIEDISVSRVGNDLVLDINDPNNVSINDKIIIENWHLGSYQIEHFEFSSGEIVGNLEATYASMLGSEGDDVINLWSGISYFEGLGGNDVVTSLYTENNTILGGDGNDIITDKGGDDTILGGAGNDTLNIEGTGNNIILGDDGADVIHISNTSSNVVLGGSGDDLIQVESIDLFNNSNAGQINFYEGGLGNDSFSSGASSDTYIFNRGDGQDSINDNSQSVTLSGVDIITFNEMSYEELWFTRTDNDLNIIISGSDDRVNIENWYSHDDYQIEVMSVGNSILLNNQVDLLVNAMASYDVPQGVGNVIPQETKDALSSTLVEAWQS